MSGESMPQITTNERVTSKFLRRLRSLAARDLHDMLAWLSAKRSTYDLATKPIRPSVVDGLRVEVNVGMTVKVGTGLAFAVTTGETDPIVGASPTEENSAYVMLNKRVATSSVLIAAAHATLQRYDLIEVMPTATPASVGVDQSEIVQQYDDVTDTYVPTGAPVPVMVHGEPDIVVTTGTPGATNSCPAPTAGRVPIAVVRVRPAAVAITQSDIIDVRQFLGEMVDAGARAQGRINVGEINIVYPFDAGNSRPADIVVDADVDGVRASIMTTGSFSLDPSTTNAYDSFLDPNFTDFTTYTGWVYFYMVATDDRGLRYSRSGAIDIAGTVINHAGCFVVSKVKPSVSLGAMQPSAAIKTPYLIGNATCTPGTGQAICIGMAYWSGQRFTHGLQLSNGQARFTRDSASLPTLPMKAWTFTSSGAASTSQTSSYQADFDDAVMPIGPIAFDVHWTLAFENLATPKTCPQNLIFGTSKAGDTAALLTVADIPTTGVPDAAAAAYTWSGLVRDFPVSRVMPNRSVDQSGLAVVFSSRSGTNHQVQLRSATSPVVKMAGYRWPVGPVLVNP